MEFIAICIGEQRGIKMNKPIILDNAVERTGDGSNIFKYDYSKDMNVVKMENITIPFIDIGESSELLTKTKVDRESDDDEFRLLELLTKSAEDRERDDDEYMSFAELVSKTFVDRERDDEDDININQ